MSHASSTTTRVENAGIEPGYPSTNETGQNRKVGIGAGPELLVVIAGPFIVEDFESRMIAVGKTGEYVVRLKELEQDRLDGKAMLRRIFAAKVNLDPWPGFTQERLSMALRISA